MLHTNVYMYISALGVYTYVSALGVHTVFIKQAVLAQLRDNYASRSFQEVMMFMAHAHPIMPISRENENPKHRLSRRDCVCAD